MRRTFFKNSISAAHGGLGVLFLALTFAISACKQESGNDEIVVDDDYYEFQEFKLKDYEIPASISLPDETANIGASRPEVEHIESDIQWVINVGPNFQMIIEDFGDIRDLVKEKKKELADQPFFKVRYLVDDEDMIVYERTLVVSGSSNAAPEVGIEHKTYHVYAQKKVGKYYYALQSREDGYEKHIIELMAKSIRSFKPIGQ